MALKDLLVVVDDGAASAARLDLAARLAARDDAHLTALYAYTDVSLPGYIQAEIPADLRAGRRKDLDARVARAAQRFDDAMRRHGRTERSEWLAVERDPTTAAAVHGRYADLIVVGQPDPDRDRDELVAQPADLLFESGRPLLVVPYAGTFATIGERVLVGWNGSREAARAIGDALPLLRGAKRVVVMAANPKPGPKGLGDEPCADIARHLSRHGCRVEATHVATDVVEPGDTILNTAADEGCDLLVMGAYGRSRLRELVLGGMTRYMLQHMTVPVLMSH
ncbi:universal stress protein [Azospirillum doebereinerae]|uniref:Universal stress protein n=1 Tax=Azospirillum doebereinerae TaxID=92933 RepID=A0A433J1W0_9PROT|nr:universal stress protein [Azospirillum doebereinerae]RUQ65064.1 universal stress protein [Azospirillum doebereinerae]